MELERVSPNLPIFDQAVSLELVNRPPKKSLRDIIQEFIVNNDSSVALTFETVITEGLNPLHILGPRLHSTDEVTTSGEVSVRVIYGEHEPFALGVLDTKYRGIFHIFGSIPSTDPRWRRVYRWIQRASPALVPCFLDHDDYLDIGRRLTALGPVEVGRITARRTSDLSSLTRGWNGAHGRERPTPIEAIAEAENEGAAVRSLTLRAGEGRSALAVHIRREAGATYYSGSFSEFEEHVLTPLSTAASRRRELLTGRRRQGFSDPVRPIVIRFKQPVMRDREATGELISELEHLPRLAIAVLHRNPYLHIIATDYDDGSNYDIVVTRPHQIEIIPSFRSSMGSLARISQSIGTRFESATIDEADDLPRVSLSELAADG